MIFPIREFTPPLCEGSSFNEVHPPVERLFYQGNRDLLLRPGFAIVGGRRASLYGRRAAIQFARKFSDAGWSVVSGLARGVDGAAHFGAILGTTPTIAVLGSGLNRVYPPEHSGLAQRILDGGGLLLSEYPPTTPPEKFRFPQRNRIIAAIAQGVLVIQAREKSGSLITAKCALDLGRDVYVVPGPFDDESFAGGHSLVQDGAMLVRGPEDILGAPDEVTKSPGDFWTEFFTTHGEVMTLEEIFTASHLPLAVILEDLEELKVRGEIVEMLPGTYSTINACQTTKFSEK